MTPERFRRIADLYDAVLRQPPPERPRFLAEHCSGDDGLRAEVESLLAANAQASGFLSTPAKEVAAALLANEAPPPADVGIEPGRTIGPYCVVRRIGSGGMGHVYLAEDARLARKIALKCLQSELAANSRGMARLEEEARAASALNHPNIITVYDLVEADGQKFIAQEFIEGETLRERVLRGRLPVTEIADIGAQVSHALAAAHAAGIVHGDIKPANIMVRADGLVKVLDFGLARQSGSAAGGVAPTGAQTTPMGTLHYMSPEQSQRQPVDSRTDIFSLGVVLYEMAAGVTPFHGDSETAAWFSLLHDTPPPLRSIRTEIPVRLDRLVSRALEKDPARRPQNAGEMAAELRALNASWRWQRLAASVAAAAIVLAAVLFWLTRPAPVPHAVGMVQLTNDGQAKQTFAVDGEQIYYGSGDMNPDLRVFRVSANGGEPIPMPQLQGMGPLGVSPDRSRILLVKYRRDSGNGPYELWVAHANGGAPSPLHGLMATEAAWSPDGEAIVYCAGPELWTARADGSEARRLATLRGFVHTPRWSPDGRRIRFTLMAKNSNAIWGVAADGSGPRALLPDWGGRNQEDGAWTPDGHWFIFSARLHDLWALRENRGWFAGSPSTPVRLTAGPLLADLVQPGGDGHRIFFRGLLNRGELVRYDHSSGNWSSYLNGEGATQLDYSRDNKWIVWTSYPERVLWRSAVDGGSRVQLTQPPLRASGPRWSPDGTQIAFYGGLPGKPARVYVMAAGGGAIRQLTHGQSGPGGDVDETWSPDGGSVAFGSDSLDAEGSLALHVMDVKSGREETLPDSQGLWSPRWSPDGRYIAALGGRFKLWLYDVKTRARTQLTAGDAGWPNWSRDGRYLYFEDDATTTWRRVRIADRFTEPLADLRTFKFAQRALGWTGNTPDESLISTRDAGSTEIYALDWDAY